ncbi:MAG: hypothetical protein, partial [Olavius algarvensis Gamma 3 endosymbiont]
AITVAAIVIVHSASHPPARAGSRSGNRICYRCPTTTWCLRYRML